MNLLDIYICPGEVPSRASRRAKLGSRRRRVSTTCPAVVCGAVASHLDAHQTAIRTEDCLNLCRGEHRLPMLDVNPGLGGPCEVHLRSRGASDRVHKAKRQELFSRIITEYKRFVEHVKSARILARQPSKLDSVAIQNQNNYSTSSNGERVAGMGVEGNDGEALRSKSVPREGNVPCPRIRWIEKNV